MDGFYGTTVGAGAAAYSDLDEIFEYIMADNPQAAADMLGGC